jgi:putative acetyltransferase
MVTIIEYEDRYYADFRQLNLEWLEKYNLVESHDLEILDDPKAAILDGGGAIFLALLDNEIVGTAALIAQGPAGANEIQVPAEYYELAKMSVAPLHRGRGISKLLIGRCLDKAREIGVKKLVLYSNSQLQTAIKLYEKYGFQHVPPIDTPFVTADVKMELQIQ